MSIAGVSHSKIGGRFLSKISGREMRREEVAKGFGEDEILRRRVYEGFCNMTRGCGNVDWRGQQRRITSRSLNETSMDSESPLKKTRAMREEGRPRAPASSRNNKSIVISRKLYVHVRQFKPMFLFKTDFAVSFRYTTRPFGGRSALFEANMRKIMKR